MYKILFISIKDMDWKVRCELYVCWFHIQSEYGKIRAKTTPNSEPSHAVWVRRALIP